MSTPEIDASDTVLADLKLVDPTRLQELVGDQTEMLRALVDLFITDTRNHVDRLDALIQSANLKEAARTAHAIKGSAANVGAPRLQRAAYAWEQKLRQEQLPPGASHRLREVFDATCDELVQLLPSCS